MRTAQGPIPLSGKPWHGRGFSTDAMTSRQINLSLWAASAILCACAIAAVAWTIFNPLQGEPLPVSARATPTTQPTAMVNLPSPSDMDPILDKPLRHSLASSSAAAIATTQQNSNDPPLVLVGTIGNSLAMLKTRDGRIELKSVGESISGLTILAIAPSKIEGRYNGRVIQLEKQRRG